ncbi:GNAT family N-acetyltransferase [Marinibacterium profundimaris]|uniref:Acetyltransferase n=1 Tax=Marinibacterium profundimaris TaxID=1679460 RepID=A0A225NM46_9RHOB|nr:GNAT family N-acetyltransferase [Marinibacterium profundimaris]OWU75116.1 acetyltransferase [Marinibacterium profundimaris]
MDAPVIREFRAGDAPWLVERHQTLYARDEGFDDSFGPLVAAILDAFIAGHDPACERGWIAEAGDRRLGSIFCVRLDDRTAKLRLFLLEPEARGQGLGKRLLATCMGFARGAGYGGMQLWTHESHRAACALYRATGWELTESKPVTSFGVQLVEQSWRISL